MGYALSTSCAGAPTGFRIVDAQFTEWSSSKPINSNLTQILKLKCPLLQMIQSFPKKEIWHTNNTNSVLNVFWFKVTTKTTVQLYVLCNSKRGQNYCLQIHNFTFCGRTCVSCVRPWAPLVMRAHWRGGGGDLEFQFQWISITACLNLCQLGTHEKSSRVRCRNYVSFSSKSWFCLFSLKMKRYTWT